MRILIWHGYLLGGTGSNVYTRQLAREWSREGHEVTVLCQEPHPERYELGGAEVVRPDVGDLLPVFVLDRYEGYRARLLQDCSRAELDAWVEANAAAVGARLPADFLLCNHVLLGGAVGAASGAPYAVKAHGSELEYSMRGRPALEAWGREVLEPATSVFVGSAHIRDVLEDVCGHIERVHEVPPGVDVEEWRPRPRGEALAGLIEEARRDPPNPGNANERLPDEGNAERLAEFLTGGIPTVVYFGKLLHNKGVHVLLDALKGFQQGGALKDPTNTLGGHAPAGVQGPTSSLGGHAPGGALQGSTSSTGGHGPGGAPRGPTVPDPSPRAVIVGFGDYRGELERLADPARTLFTGPLEHRHLVQLLALADACVVPSIFPEAFGMVAAEAAAAGCPPIVARHSGLAEVAEGLEAEYPRSLGHLVAFATGDAADLRAKLAELLALPPSARAEISEAARRAAVTRWSWKSVADRLLELGR